MSTPLRQPATALIAEDEPLLAQALQADLAAVWPELKVIAHAVDGEQAIDDALSWRPELIFMDIRMPGRSGLEAAQAIIEDWPAEIPLPLLVFVTAYDQYALQAFELAAADYLLKPAPRERLAQTCERLRERLAQREHAPAEARGADDQLLDRLRLLLGTAPALAGALPTADQPLTVIQASSGSTVHLVPIEDVIYFEAADKYVRVLTAEREHLIRSSLRELLPQLDPARFWQVHRGLVVQAREIDHALRDESGKVQLVLRRRPERLAVSRLYAARFKGM
ncbi:response regulator transcription factor [Ideonella sp. 4Y16]|uniref:Response regulator transcription factor n=1 Tax=Ideonella alba TaxID=2824118 RepID=A0A940YI92_9BURK|nr:LytTR family DNA-binding domain-containing protein [Ideonella alba]MBQ0932922.1 response regulator transcription factor [Ideonella alba]MBQ0942671.1 response regulator transcription factor [Ideonella alba]